MCGIVGHLANKALDQGIFNRMRDTLAHRGPDGMGSVFLEDNAVALGHRRLAIIDLSTEGSQPMCNEDETIWITFNGEIYNYAVLRQALIATGNHRFHSATDTEVLLHGYEEWGLEGLVGRLKGMFAFGIWDSKQKTLHLARDRFGIKPLVYYADANRIVFASELKALAACPDVPKHIDEEALADYFTYSYIPYPKTIWSGISKLPPAHTLSYDFTTRKTRTQRYWQLKTEEQDSSDREALDKANALIHQATKEHLVSDVPVGLFLSGGYDSTTLLMHMSEMHYPTTGFTIAFPDSEQNEASQAAAAAQAFGAKHEIEAIGRDADIFQLLQEMSPIYDEPFAGDSMINAWLVSRLAARHSKVALSGEGADEVFGGYKWHRKIEAYYRDIHLKQRIKNVLQGNWTAQKVFLALYNRSMPGVFKEAVSLPILNGALRNSIRVRGLWHFLDHDLPHCLDPVKRSQYLDTHTFIPNHCLFRADLSSMAHSLEVRVPFLDHHIYEFVFSLQRKVYMKPGVKKFLLEEHLKEKVPASVLDMPKRGFSFQNPENMYDERFTALLNNGELVKRGIVQRGVDWSTLSSHFKFHVLNLELWMRNHG